MALLERNLVSFTGLWGVAVEIRVTTLLVPALFMAFGYGDIRIVLMLGLGLVFLLSIYLHELGHAWACVVQGVKVERVVLHFLGGYCLHKNTATLKQRELIVAMGPIVNLVIWAVFGLLAALPVPELLVWALWGISVLNLALAGFNLLPMMPRDGGWLCVLFLARIFSEKTALRITAAFGFVIMLLWLPAFALALVLYDFLLLYWLPLRLHWRMLRHGDFGEVYSPVKRRFWQWRRRPEGPWDRVPVAAPAE